MMKITKISWSLVLYLALLEGLALLTLEYLPQFGGFFVGFIPAFLVLLIYLVKVKYLPVKINKDVVTNVPIFFFSIANGLFMMLLFSIQNLITNVIPHMFVPIFGLLSVFLAAFVILLIYNIQPLKFMIILNKKKVLVKKIDLMFAVYAGLFEFFILPLMFVFYFLNWNVFVNGFIAGLIGGAIGLFITNKIIKKSPINLF